MFQPTRKKLLKQFEAALNGSPSPPKEEAIRKITAGLPADEAKETLIGLLRTYGINTPKMSGLGRANSGFWPDSWRTVAYGELIDKLCTPHDAFELLRQTVLNDTDEDRRIEALEHAARCFAGRDDCFRLVTDCTDGGREAENYRRLAEAFPDRPDYALYIRRENLAYHAFDLIVRYFPARRESVSYLREAITSSDDGVLQRNALHALAAHHGEDPETLSFLERAALVGVGPMYSPARPEALRAYVELAPKDDRLFRALCELAPTSWPGNPAGASMFLMAEHFRSHPDTLPFLIEQARRHSSVGTRDSAVIALATHFADRPEVPEFLMMISGENDSIDGVSWNRRSLSLRLLFETYSGRPEVRDHIRCRLELEPVDHVREDMVTNIGRRFPEEESTKQALLKRLRDDPSEAVREAGRRVLASEYKLRV